MPGNAHFRQIADSARHFAILSTDTDGRITYANPGVKSVLGWEPDALTGLPIATIFTPEDVAAGVPAQEMAAARENGYGSDERWHLRRDGRRFWAIGEVTPLKDAGGRLCGYVKILQDRTEAKRHQDAAAHAQARLRMALEAGRMGAWEWNMRTGEVLLLDGTPALHGLPGDAPSLTLPTMADYASLIHPEDRPGLERTVSAAVVAGGAHRLEYRVQPPGGGVRWLEVRGTVLCDAAGAPCMMHGVSVDITARKQAEQDRTFLEQASGELATLVDVQSTIDKVVRLAVPNFADWCAVDLVQNGQLVRLAVAHVDPAKVALAHELHERFPPKLGDPTGSWRIVHGGQPNFVPQLDQDMIRAAIPEPERRAILLDLGLRSYIGVPLISHGEVIGVATFIAAESGRIYTPQDLELATEFARRAAIAIDNARLYQAVQQADHDKDVFLATLSHELRNPLAAISNAVALMGIQPQRAAAVQQVMQRQVGQLSRLVDDLLDISRIATGKIGLRRAPVDLRTVLEHAVEATRPLVEARRHRLDVRCPDDPVEVSGDAARLTQVFANLLGNAAKFTPEGGRIDVDVTSREGECAVRVRDSGIGIDAEMLPRLFQLFAQGRQVEGSASGLGIGLALAERLVQLHGGDIMARSDGPGQGSEFTVRLPVTATRAAPAPAAGSDAAAPSTDSWWRGRRVLVVDDNVDAATTLGALLQTFGALVQVVHDGPAALDAVRAEPPAAVLLDIGMPVMDGLEVARRLRADPAAAGVLLIALTGWGQAHDREAALAAGFDRHWVKPVSLERLRTFDG